MISEKKGDEFEKRAVDEDYLMNIISGDQPVVVAIKDNQEIPKKNNAKEKIRHTAVLKKENYEDFFLTNRFPSGRNGKVIYIRPEYHERLLRIVQLSREERTTLYSYIDNILELHFREYGDDITNYFNQHFKPIL